MPRIEQCGNCHGEGTDLLKPEQLQFPDHETDQLVGELPEVDVSALVG